MYYTVHLRTFFLLFTEIAWAAFLPQLLEEDVAKCDAVLNDLRSGITDALQKRARASALPSLAIYGVADSSELLVYAKTFTSLRKHGVQEHDLEDSDTARDDFDLFLFGNLKLPMNQYAWNEYIETSLDALGVVRIQMEYGLQTSLAWAPPLAALAAAGYKRVLLVTGDVMATRRLPLPPLRADLQADKRPLLSGVLRGPLVALVLSQTRDADDLWPLARAATALEANAGRRMYLEPVFDPSVLLFTGGAATDESSFAAAGREILLDSLRAYKFARVSGVNLSPLIALGVMCVNMAPGGQKSDPEGGETFGFRLGHLGPAWAYQFGLDWLHAELQPTKDSLAEGNSTLAEVSYDYTYRWMAGSADQEGRQMEPPVFVRFVYSRPWESKAAWPAFERDNPAVVRYLMDWRALSLRAPPPAAAAAYSQALPAALRSTTGGLEGAATCAGGCEERGRGEVLYHDDATLLRIKRFEAGTLMYLLNDCIGSELDRFGEWEHGFLELAKAILQPGWTVFDLGSHIGTHAVTFARAVGYRGRVIAAEPQRPLYNLVLANAALNGLEHILEARNVAVGESAGAIDVPHISFHGSAYTVNFGGLILQQERPAGAATYSVPLVTVDSLTDGLQLEGENNKCPQFIKLDVEGMELQALFGASRTLEDCKPFVYMETNSARRSGPAELMAHIATYGYFCHYHNSYYVRPAGETYFETSKDDLTSRNCPLSWNVLCGATEEHARVAEELGLLGVRNTSTDCLYHGRDYETVCDLDALEITTGLRVPICTPEAIAAAGSFARF